MGETDEREVLTMALTDRLPTVFHDTTATIPPVEPGLPPLEPEPVPPLEPEPCGPPVEPVPPLEPEPGVPP